MTLPAQWPLRAPVAILTATPPPTPPPPTTPAPSARPGPAARLHGPRDDTGVGDEPARDVYGEEARLRLPRQPQRRRAEHVFIEKEKVPPLFVGQRVGLNDGAGRVRGHGRGV